MQPNPAKRSRRDGWLLPLLSLLTLVVLAGGTELIARWAYPSLPTVGEDCMVFNDPATGARGVPNSVCYEKLPEGELTEYRFNGCGHRAGMECGLKPPGDYRIVMVGSSFATGMRVPREETFAALLPADLSRDTGKRIELYNEAMPWRLPHVIAQHIDEVLATQPDMILWILTQVDIRNELLNAPDPKAVPVEANPLLRKATELWHEQKTGFLLRHLVYESPSQYVKSYLMRDNDAQFLRGELPAEWQSYLRQLDQDTAVILSAAKAAHVPVAAVFLPERVQAAMISRGEWPAGFDPYRLNATLRPIIESHGGIFLDILPALRQEPHPEQGYFSIDGHPNARGHAMLARLLATALRSTAPAVLQPADAGAATPVRSPGS